MLSRITACLVLLAGLMPVEAHAQAVRVPPGLPAHFGFGLSASPADNWMQESGIPWTYRFQYLAGGVNTGQGWETWNPNGTFALIYAEESARSGFIPMFPYYEMFQTNGPCNGCPENQKNLSNLNDPSTMNAYYANFALLMKRLGPGNHDGVQGFGKTVLVNIEPDLSGGYVVQAVNDNSRCFGLCSGQGNNPNLLRTSVANSGFPEAVGFPDTYVGMTQVLASLRDRYAPNVILGYDVSPWATGYDLGLDTRPNLDGSALGRQVGTFLNQVGPHEVLFHNPLDRDAGQYKVSFGQNRWWDRENVTFPNFRRWQEFLRGAIEADGSKPMLLWQVPAGNQYFRTMDNTDGHFQDNRAEYIFSHIPELIATGVIAALFAPGNAGGTVWHDGKRDGVTNPPAVCTSDGTSTGQMCNDHVSTVADDDGGFIRMSGQAYYQNPVPLTATAPPLPVSAPAPPPPLVVHLGGSGADPEVVWQEVLVSSDATLLIDFELYDADGHKVWQAWHAGQRLLGGLATTQTAALGIDGLGLPPGEYTLKTGVFSDGWGILYAWNDQAGTLSID